MIVFYYVCICSALWATGLSALDFSISISSIVNGEAGGPPRKQQHTNTICLDNSPRSWSNHGNALSEPIYASLVYLWRVLLSCLVLPCLVAVMVMVAPAIWLWRQFLYGVWSRNNWINESQCLSETQAALALWITVCFYSLSFRPRLGRGLSKGDQHCCKDI